VAQRYPRVLVARMLAARAALAAGGPQEAEQALAIANGALQDFPTAAEPAEVAATALAGLGRWDEAARAAEQWKQRDPTSAGADIALATAQLSRRQPQPQAATAALEKYVARAGDAAASTEPVVASATILYAQALVLSGRTADAEKLLAGRIGSPQYRAAWVALAARHVPDPAAAERWLAAAAQQATNPTLADDEAMAEGWLALARRSGNPAHRDRAAALVKALASRAEGSAEAKAEELAGVAILCEDAGDRAAAERLYSRALQKDASHAIALNNLAMILVDRNDAAAAEPYAARAAATEHPRQANFLDTLATVQEKGRRWDKAGASIDRAVEMDPTNVSFQIHRAVILAAGGDSTRARRALDAVDGLGLEDPRLSQTDKDRLKSLRQRAAAGQE